MSFGIGFAHLLVIFRRSRSERAKIGSEIALMAPYRAGRARRSLLRGYHYSAAGFVEEMPQS